MKNHHGLRKLFFSPLSPSLFISYFAQNPFVMVFLWLAMLLSINGFGNSCSSLLCCSECCTFFLPFMFPLKVKSFSEGYSPKIDSS